MKLNLAIIFAVAGLALGGGAGVGARMVMKPAAAAQKPPTQENSDHAPEAEDGHAPKPKEKTGKSKGHGEEKKEERHYFKFSRQFVVPVLVNGSPGATMVLDVLIEMKPGFEDLYSDEPALRDAVLRALLRKTSEGALSRIFSEPETMDALRAEILAEVDIATHGAAQSILVLDIGYQGY